MMGRKDGIQGVWNSRYPGREDDDGLMDECMSYFYKERLMIHKKFPLCNAGPTTKPRSLLLRKKPQKMEEKPNVQERRMRQCSSARSVSQPVFCIASCMQFSRR